MVAFLPIFAGAADLALAIIFLSAAGILEGGPAIEDIVVSVALAPSENAISEAPTIKPFNAKFRCMEIPSPILVSQCELFRKGI
jgi:hypothetical protein